jgi:predicted MFS family arabinose efflux permease
MAPADDLARRRWLVLASAVLSFFAVGATFFAVPPLVPQLVEKFALDHLLVGILMGSIAVPAIVLSIPVGAAVDHLPARASGNVGLLLMAVGGTVFALASSYPLLLLGRLIFGAGGLLINLLLARMVTAAFAGRELSLAMGIFNSVYPATMIVMFTLHPVLLRLAGWRGELLALAALAVAALPLHNIALPAGPRPGSVAAPSPRARGRVTPALVALAATWMLFFGVYAAVFTFAPEWAGGDAAALRTVALIAWAALVLAPAAGAAIDRTGHPAWWLAAGLALLSAVLVAMAFGAIGKPTAMVVVGGAAAVALTSTYSLPARLVPAANVGFAFGVITAFSNLATLVGPAATGAIRDADAGAGAGAGWGTPWTMLAAAALAGALIAIGIREPRGPDPSLSAVAGAREGTSKF